jgi:hypothetical protein
MKTKLVKSLSVSEELMEDFLNDVYEDTIDLDEVYIGFRKSESKERGFITRPWYSNGSFVLMSCKSVTNGNSFGEKEEYETFDDAVKFLMNNNFIIYKFDNHQELFTWLGSDAD